MGNILENNLEMNQNQLLEKALKIQNLAYGVLDVPFLLDVLKNNSVKRLLDIGTGEGSFILKVAEECPDITFLAIDQNDQLLQVAEASREQMRVENVKFKNSFFDSGFHSGKFDLIFSRFCLEHASRPEEFIQEVFSRLNKGGLFVVIEEYWFDSGLEDKIWQEYRRQMLKAYQKFGANPYIPKYLNAWLQKAGFQDIKSSLPMYSPITIGEKNFRSLILTIPVLFYKFYPDTWSLDFINELEQWIDEVLANKKIDPFISFAHVVAKK